MGIDAEWAERVRAWCDQVFESADAEFAFNCVQTTPSGGVSALLWEAEPRAFARRFPDSRIEESYGEQWPDVHCVDYWVYLDRVPAAAVLSVEGWSHGSIEVPVTGDGDVDGRAIATRFAEILRVAAPMEPS